MSFNVLIVDDSVVMRAMILKTLRLSGLPLQTVHEASNGRQALEVLARNWVDLALVDISMPVMNGEDLLDQIRRNPGTANLPVIIVSSEGSETRIARLKNQGAEFVRKPIAPEVLREKIIKITGVSDEQLIREGTDSGSGSDF